MTRTRKAYRGGDDDVKQRVPRTIWTRSRGRGVSKQPSQALRDKEAPLSEVVISTVNEASDPVHYEVLELRDIGTSRPTRDSPSAAPPDAAAVISCAAWSSPVVAASPSWPHVLRAGPRPRSWAWQRPSSGSRAAGCSTDRPALGGAQFNWLVISGPLTSERPGGARRAPGLERHAYDGVRTSSPLRHAPGAGEAPDPPSGWRAPCIPCHRDGCTERVGRAVHESAMPSGGGSSAVRSTSR